MRQLPWLLLALIGSTVLSIGLVWGSRIPLGIPGEWEWSRLPPETSVSFVLALGLAALFAAGYLWFVRLGAARMTHAGRWERGCWLVGLAAAGFTWLWTAQESAPPAYQLS